MIKDEAEIAAIRKACSISDQAFRDALDFIKPGKTEIEIANFLDFRMRELGASGLSFDTILASGINSSKPHAHPMHTLVILSLRQVMATTLLTALATVLVWISMRNPTLARLLQKLLRQVWP
ncbi:aminopeptidase P [Streptococcus pneumoniae]|nr:aminopeptidase P [Streptococcus pneumoniae]